MSDLIVVQVPGTVKSPVCRSQAPLLAWLLDREVNAGLTNMTQGNPSFPDAIDFEQLCLVRLQSESLAGGVML
ncbi:MAG: hypothetical protein CMJ65_10170 [Planctomycetaceae bacterium]|nr:hypothetical protein [Planctomycetaceae bacterium]